MGPNQRQQRIVTSFTPVKRISPRNNIDSKATQNKSKFYLRLQNVVLISLRRTCKSQYFVTGQDPRGIKKSLGQDYLKNSVYEGWQHLESRNTIYNVLVAPQIYASNKLNHDRNANEFHRQPKQSFVMKMCHPKIKKKPFDWLLTTDQYKEFFTSLF